MDNSGKKLTTSPEVKANPISKLFLLWTTSFLRKGAKQGLNLEDVYHSLPGDSSEALGNKFDKKWTEEISNVHLKGKRPKLWKVVWRAIAFKFVLGGFGYIFDELVLRIMQPLVLREFILTFNVQPVDDEHSKHLRRQQYIYASLLSICALGHSLVYQKVMTTLIHVGMRARLGICSLIYRKTLKISKSNSEQSNVGKLCNMLSSDVGRLDYTLTFLHVLYVGPIQLGIFSYLLWSELGIACLGGLGGVFVVLPCLVCVGRLFLHFRVQIGRMTDERGRFLNEIISGIRLIKMYTWEKPFALIIANLRKLEVKFIRRSLYMRGLFLSVHIISTKLIPFCALILYVALGNELTAEKAFFTISIFNTLMQAIMSRIPTAVSELGDLLASLKRVEDFLLSTESIKDRGDNVFHGNENHWDDNVVPGIQMENFSAGWSEENHVLKNITLELKGNKLVMIVGHVGCGKSSLLSAILGELPVADRNACWVQGRISYASQEAWIFPATVRENILFGLEMDEDRYWETIRACCLSEDLKRFSNGDLTLVGERGVALSGGQKARVNLARAVYQDRTNIYLFDDPLSAVDTKVSKALFSDCIRKHLEGKLRILVTHQLQYLPMADYIVVLNREGQIWGQGTYEELQNSEIDFTSLISEDFMSASTPDVDEMRSEKKASQSETGPTEKESNENQVEKKNEEKKVVGSVGPGVYFRYLRSGGSIVMIIFLVTVWVSTETMRIFTDFWLSQWTNSIVDTNKSKIAPGRLTRYFYHVYEETATTFGVESDQDEPSLGDNFYMKVYCGLMGGFIILGILRSTLFFRFCMRISINLHNRMFQSVVRAPVKFFDVNPSGRIMNRFTKDLNQIDERLPLAFHDFLNIFLNLLGVLALTTSSNYYLAVPASILLITLWRFRSFYLKSARELKRIESVAKSPLFTHVAMTVQGLTTIRALKAENRVFQRFDVIQDTHTSAWYMMFITSRWFAIWLEMMSVAFLTVVAFGFLILTTSSQGGSVGVAISSILTLSGALQWGVRQSAETENYMTSVERAIEYSKLEPEAPLEVADDANISKKWPEAGSIIFTDVSLAYDEENENQVLKEISFCVKPSQKVGIVGRTGAGKSSLITALFRLTELSNGQIAIDGVPVSSLGLHTLRSKISIIPQDPVLFTGTLRYNLDPFDEFQDDQLWSVLDEVDLHHAVQTLDSPVADGGANFSVGQRQLVCLARAILRRNKIIVLDEATANVDPATDQLVQKTIRSKFSECTILTIAHRLQTVLDNDVILVLDAGKLIEFGSPATLAQNQEGIFYGLLHHNSQTISSPT